MTAKSRELTQGDREIFAAARRENNPNRITNYYLRNEDSGTYWRPVSNAEIAKFLLPQSADVGRNWQQGYLALTDLWQRLRQPEYFGPDLRSPDLPWIQLNKQQYKDRSEKLLRVYRVVDDGFGNEIFHHPHGVQLLDWQLQMWRSRQPVQVIVGGFGSGKTWSKIIHMIVRAVMLPGYRAFALAPYSIQSSEVFKQALQIIEGTMLERFLVSSPSKPFPTLNFENDLVGKTSIECYPVLDDPAKIRTLTGDEALLDQAEKMDESLDDFMRDAGTRLRGQVRGRPRQGQISLIANSEDSPMLWDWFEESKTDPDWVWAHQPPTFANLYLTMSDLTRFEKIVGKDDSARRMYLLGERPIGSGSQFSRQLIENIHAPYLDDMMTEAINENKPGYVRLEASKVGVYRWELPYDPAGTYFVAADPGWGNPPDRNSPAIFVWRIDDFPNTPAVLAAFHWVSGNGSPDPWIQQFIEYTYTYKAIGRAAHDATAWQKGYERWVSGLKALMPTPIDMSGQKKFTYLTLLRLMMMRKLLEMPNLSNVFSQLAKYTLPDAKLRQDLVMALTVSAAWLEPMFYMISGEGDVIDYDPEDRDFRAYSEERDVFHEER